MGMAPRREATEIIGESVSFNVLTRPQRTETFRVAKCKAGIFGGWAGCSITNFAEDPI
jgi:hypothetical protein